MAIAAIMLASCEKENEGDQSHQQKPAKANITDAKALYLTASSSHTRSDDEYGKLFKINESGTVTEVSFTEQNGEAININIGHIFKVSDDFILVNADFIIDDPRIVTSNSFGLYWLIRKRDGAIFDLGYNYGSVIIQNMAIKPSTLMVDRSGSLYWRGIDVMRSGPIYKMSPLGNDELTATPISGDYDGIGWCYMDNQDVILFGVPDNFGFTTEWVCRFPDGTFSNGEAVGASSGGSFADRGIFCVPIRESSNGGFIVFKEYDGSWDGRIARLSPNSVNKTIDRTEIVNLNFNAHSFSRDDMPDGSYVFHSNDYKDYIFISPCGEVEMQSFETGFSYGDKKVSNNCVYGLEGKNALYRMDFDTRTTAQVFSDSRYRIDNYDVASDDSYVDIFALRYLDAKKVVLRVNGGQITTENVQSDDIGDVITFIRLN